MTSPYVETALARSRKKAGEIGPEGFPVAWSRSFFQSLNGATVWKCGDRYLVVTGGCPQDVTHHVTNLGDNVPDFVQVRHVLNANREQRGHGV